MALIFALIIFVVLIGRSMFDRMGRAQFQREYDEFQRNLEKGSEGFDRHVASIQETTAVRQNAFYESAQYEDGTPANEETALARKMRERIWNEVHIQPNPEMITCAVLAQKGLVPYEMSSSAYVTSTASPAWEFWDVEQKFFEWLDFELLSNGMSFSMRYVTSDNRSSLGHGDDSLISESIHEKETNRMGIYYWTSKQARFGKRLLIVKPYDYKTPFVDYQYDTAT